MDDDQGMSERLSALADGELRGDEWTSVLAHAASEEGQGRWRLYHEIGDALRHAEPPLAHDTQLLARLRKQLAQEPRPLRLPAVDAVTWVADSSVHAANAPLWRWKLAAGFASLVAVAAVAWDVYVGVGAPTQGAQLALAPAVAPQAVVAVQNPAAEDPVMLRDPRLDEWLAEHRKNGGAVVLQAPAGFLRNANFQASKP